MDAKQSTFNRLLSIVHRPFPEGTVFPAVGNLKTPADSVDPEKTTIQRMEMKDLDEVVCIEASGSLAPWSRNMFVEEMGNRFSFCFVIKKEDGPERPVIGFICFRNLAEDSELLKICVRGDYRQQGIGKRLMEFYINFSRESEIKNFYLEVHSSNHPAIHLYQLFAYQPSGIRKNFYEGRYDALLMTKKAS